MQLAPGEMFAIVRQIADPNDAGTYYVRATIRNARTDALLDTKDLTDRGGQRFSVEYQVPSKSSDAIYIAISTRVYTDSGYTTLSDVYGQEIETYLVEMRQQNLGGGGSGVSYEKIREIVMDVVKEIEFPEQTQAPDLRPAIAQEVDRAVSAIGEVHSAVRGIKVSPQVTVSAPKVDVRPILDAIEGARGSHETSANVSKQSHQAILEAARNVKERTGALMRELTNTHSAHGSRLNAVAEAAFNDMKKLVGIFSEPLSTPK